MSVSIFHLLPLWLDFAVFVLVLLAALEVGFRIGVRKKGTWSKDEQGGGRISLTSMFAVLGLMLAFTFAAAVNRHEARKEAVIAEANALGTAYLRAGLVAEPGRTDLRRALLEYGRTRVVDHGERLTVERFEAVLAQSQRARERLWPETERVVQAGARGPIEAALMASVNEVLDSDTTRVARVLDFLPPMVLTLLLLIAAATVSVAGFNAGLSGRISRWRTSMLIVVLTAIMTVIVDFDRPNVGFIAVSDAPLRATIAEMEAGQASGGPGTPAE
jgi:hypothetical protein